MRKRKLILDINLENIAMYEPVMWLPLHDGRVDNFVLEYDTDKKYFILSFFYENHFVDEYILD